MKLYFTVSCILILLTFIPLFLSFFKVYKKEYSKSLKLDVNEDKMLELEKGIETFFEDNKLQSNATIDQIAKGNL